MKTLIVLLTAIFLYGCQPEQSISCASHEDWHKVVNAPTAVHHGLLADSTGVWLATDAGSFHKEAHTESFAFSQSGRVKFLNKGSLEQLYAYYEVKRRGKYSSYNLFTHRGSEWHRVNNKNPIGEGIVKRSVIDDKRHLAFFAVGPSILIMSTDGLLEANKPSDKTIEHIAIGKNGELIVFAGGIYLSNDQGESWEEIPFPLDSDYEQLDGFFYNGELLIGYKHRLYISKGLHNWKQVNLGCGDITQVIPRGFLDNGNIIVASNALTGDLLIVKDGLTHVFDFPRQFGWGKYYAYSAQENTLYVSTEGKKRIAEGAPHILSFTL